MWKQADPTRNKFSSFNYTLQDQRTARMLNNYSKYQRLWDQNIGSIQQAR